MKDWQFAAILAHLSLGLSFHSELSLLWEIATVFYLLMSTLTFWADRRSK